MDKNTSFGFTIRDGFGIGFLFAQMIFGVIVFAVWMALTMAVLMQRGPM